MNFQNTRTGKGKPNTDTPILASVNQVPIRSNIIKFVKAHAILEHLPNPRLCLNEMDRVLIKGGNGSILLPVDAYNIKQILMRFLKEFPFSLGWVLQKMFRTRTLWKIPGMTHVSQINISDVEKWFNVDHKRIKYNLRLHKWFVHYGPMVLLIKLRILGTRLTVKEYAEVIIPICKR